MQHLRFLWEPFLSYGQLFEVEKNKVVYHQGEAGRGIYYLKSGEIKITLLSDHGDERIINIVPPGMLFGEHGVHGEPYLTSGTTNCPSAIYYFSDEAIAAICKDHPHAAGIYTDSLIYKFRTLAEIITHLDSPVEQQMAFYLLKLVQENGNASMNQTAFSKYIGTSRITVNKIIQKWKQRGYIELHKREIVIKDFDKIRALAHHPHED
ncbi:Crp/Fnr family transcriptional regulator [Mesobacillus subterraneus]|uniref:Crp/Fnr family transcriptional regulator n=1 Tax=Mesobacillus subterraneus TaxID=285983 RepID=UPI00203BF299|nr:Crp/Fnr family transcriptional regulator [Mesobacillus subterraneus]MCM3666309.1 Crp/Fnr family transcriptional regulator [Mesobacillus subterraneus]MCM3685307.1 Crp/Fnr family transcriptional regulator [Mesobacillus subterraneus]